jgi:pseudouridine-5'-phosphate glycosidase
LAKYQVPNPHKSIALESTVISHGLPYPENLNTAQALENIVRQNGAEPVTIAIIKGELKFGLNAQDLELLALSQDVAKVSRRDFGVIMAQKRTGATTVAATMIAAHLAGIKVFATGGIGGVHRGATTTLDISADLTELGRTPVIVVCAGAKAILDLPLTMEYLETLGVPVIGYGTDELPAFYSRESGIKLESRADTPQEVAAIAQAHWNLGLQNGIVVAVPPPMEHALPAKEVEKHIATALAAAEIAGIKGKALTPYLLDRLRLETGGQSLTSNIALLKNNAAVAAQIVLALAKVTNG